MKPKIFISGKITGDPMYKAKFAEAENFYKKKGYIVLNPAVLPSGMQPADYMRICFAMIDTADAVSFLPDFKQSAGADIEHAYCCYTDKNIRHFEDDIDNARGRTGKDTRPRYMVWENVPGAFSSTKGADFGAVLQETAKVACEQAPAVPMPKNGWPPAGCLTDMGGQWSIAWRVFDAQFWGVPQRRKRIALVADFGGITAPEILFERQGVPGYIKPCGKEGQAAPGNIETSTNTASPTGGGLLHTR